MKGARSFSQSAGHFCCDLGAKLPVPLKTPDLHIFCQANGFLMTAVCGTGANCPQNQWATARGYQEDGVNQSGFKSVGITFPLSLVSSMADKQRLM